MVLMGCVVITASFSSDVTGRFSSFLQKKLVEAAKSCAKNGATVLISNHDTNDASELYHDC